MMPIPLSAMCKCDYEVIGQWAATLMEHPALLCWWMDEPEGHDCDIIAYNKAYQFLKKIDPYHPIGCTNWWPLAYPVFAKCSDFLFPDVYPFYNYPTYLNQRDPDNKHKEHPLTLVADMVGQAVKAVKDRKPVWYLPEEFGPHPRPDGQKRYPPRIESRCMYYLALVNGAKGFMPYIWRGLIDRYKNVLPIREINELSPVLINGSPAGEVSISPTNTLVDTMLMKYQGKKYLIAVNGDSKEIKIDFTLSEKMGSIRVLFESRTVSSTGKTFTDYFEGYGVHIYKIE